MNSVLQATQLQLGYHGRALGAAFDLQLAKGETLVLLGANGSGKTTLIKTLLGLLPPVAGEILLQSKPLQQWPVNQRARILAYVPQAWQGELSFLVEEIVLMGRAARLPLFGAPGQADRELAMECLRRLQLEHLRGHSYNQLSGGQQQLVLLARALAQQASILILDEPTANLDFANQILVLEQISLLRQQGQSILLCTHQPQQALLMADQVAHCKNGAIVAHGNPQQMTTLDKLAELYGLTPQQLSKYFQFDQHTFKKN